MVALLPSPYIQYLQSVEKIPIRPIGSSSELVNNCALFCSGDFKIKCGLMFLENLIWTQPISSKLGLSRLRITSSYAPYLP